MNEIEFKVDAEPKNNYEKAKKLLFETDKAVQALTQQELQELTYQFLQYKGLYGLCQMTQQHRH